MLMSQVFKQDIGDLAIFGGHPAFDAHLYVGRPNLGPEDELLNSYRQVLERKWLSNSGPNVRELERRLAELLDVRQVICTSNGTVALEIAIRAAGLSGEVIVPSFTFVATAHALQWQMITPVFCDVDPQTHTIDPARIEELITPRTTGIIGVHTWGRACNVEALQEIADRHGLTLLFDAAHAFRCSHGGRPIGGFGKAEVFSFHATKFFNTLEGGAIATNDEAFAERIRLMKNFGFTGYDRVEHVGTNGKMNEISAATGLVSLKHVDHFIDINRRNYHCYRDNLDVRGLRLVDYPSNERANYQYIVVEVDEELLELDRDRLVVILHAENVIARRYFFPGCHRLEPYRSYFPHSHLLLPCTERLTNRVFCLPTGQEISEEQILKICDVIKFAVRNSAKVLERGISSDSLKPPQYGQTGVGRHP